MKCVLVKSLLNVFGMMRTADGIVRARLASNDPLLHSLTLIWFVSEGFFFFFGFFPF